MTNEELAALIESDAQAKAAAKRGDDESCAARCSEIAPKVQVPISASQAQYVLSARRKWGALKGAVQSTMPQSARESAQTLIDWIERGYSLDFTRAMDTDILAAVVTGGVLTRADSDALTAVGLVSQQISARQVSAAMAPKRPGGKI